MPATTNGHSSTLGFSTRAIWTGQEPCASTGATIPPVYQTSTFTLPAIGQTKGYDYSRTGNPTRTALERQLAELEGGRFGSAFGSGMAAIAGVTGLLSAGDHIVAGHEVYGGTSRLFNTILARYGIESSYVDMSDINAVANAIRPTTRLFWVETPSNPTLRITDISAIAALKRSGQLLVVDNTFATPFFQQPISMGSDIVVHSTTKYLNGHSDVVGGAVITDDPELHKDITFVQNCMGAIPGPWDSYLTLRGVKTLSLRMHAHERNAQAVAEFLHGRSDIAKVYYPGLRSHAQHELARSQMRGFGGVLSFVPRGGAARAHEIAGLTKLFSLAVSLGGVESLLCHPATMTHCSLPAETRAALGINDDLLRLSVGIEDLDDLIADLGNALDATQGGVPRVPGGIEWR
jgi:cystathionine gamma-lyase